MSKLYTVMVKRYVNDEEFYYRSTMAVDEMAGLVNYDYAVFGWMYWCFA